MPEQFRSTALRRTIVTPLGEVTLEVLPAGPYTPGRTGGDVALWLDGARRDCYLTLSHLPLSPDELARVEVAQVVAWWHHGRPAAGGPP